MRHFRSRISDIGIIVTARLISGITGFVALAYAANYLTPIQFTELTLYQTILFLALIIFDAGIVQEAILNISGEKGWMRIASRFQGIRVLEHCLLGSVIIMGVLIGVIGTHDSTLAIYAAFALISNVLNIDWVLISQDRKRIWAIKAILVGAVNVFCTIYLLRLTSNPTAIFISIIIANCVGAIYLYKSKCVPAFFPKLPSRTELRAAVGLSITGIVTHGAYNMPLLIATSIIPVQISASFACLYRVFSSSTLFIPPITDFRVAQIIADLKSDRAVQSSARSVFFSLLLPCIAIVSPILILPNDTLYRFLSIAIDLSKYSLTSDSLVLMKCALIFYCIEYCALRMNYIIGNKRSMLRSVTIGFAFSGLIAIAIFINPDRVSIIWLFSMVYCYQIVASLFLLSVCGEKSSAV